MKRALCMLLLLAASCSGPRTPERRYSLTEWEGAPLDTNIRRLVIAATHNIDGRLAAGDEHIDYGGGKKVDFMVGGSAAIMGHLKVLRQRFPQELLLLDTGNIFGAMDGNEASGEGARRSIADYYKDAGYDAVLFTDRELDYELRTTWGRDPAREKIPFVNSTILSLKAGAPYVPPGSSSERLFILGDLKVGIIGLAMPGRKTAVMTGHTFEDPILSLLRSRQTLRQQGAEVIILLAQVPNSCVGSSLDGVKTADKGHQHPLMCQESKDPLMALLERLPPNSVDAVIVGGGPWAQAFHKDIPVVQGQGQANYLSLLEVFYDKGAGKVARSKTRLFYPIKMCHSFVLANQDCYRDEFELNPPRREATKGSHMALAPPKFLGLEVVISK